MATMCPECGKGKLKKGEKMAYCSERITKKVNGKFVNEGCNFSINFKQDVFGKNLEVADIKDLIAGKTITSSLNHKMSLDLANKDFFTKIEFAQKEEDEDL